MKHLIATLCLVSLFATLGGAARADGSANSPLLAALVNANQVCKDNAQKNKAALEKSLAQSPDMPPAARAQVAETVKNLDQVIATTTALLNDPAIKTGGADPERLAMRLYNATQLSNAVESSARQELGLAPSSQAEEIRAKQMQVMNSDPSLMVRFSHAWDGLAKSSQDDEGFSGEGVGTNFFGANGSAAAPVVVVSAYQPTTVQSAKEVFTKYGGTPGGVALEGIADGLGPVSTVTYDPRYNALIMDGGLVYFIKMPPWDAAALCREIANDNKSEDAKDPHDGERVAVSMGTTPEENLIFGAPSTYQDSDVAQDLFLTDGFLASVVFGSGVYHWSDGYAFPDGYQPRQADHFDPLLVYFTFKNFAFNATGGELRVARESLDVTLMPISTTRAPSGAFVPDYDKLGPGHWQPPPAFVENAAFLTSHVDFFRRERLIAKAFAYGELAALFRSYKSAGVDLSALATDLTNAPMNGG